LKKSTAALAAGGAIVRVPLGNRRGVYAILDRADWDAWIKAGRSRTFFLNDNGQGGAYVRFRDTGTAGRVASVARTLVNPGPGKIVRYRDGQPLNLTRQNLVVTDGHARGQRRDEPAHAADATT
jgi:hypothetical protein